MVEPRPALQFLRGFLEAIALWVLVTIVLCFFFGGREWRGSLSLTLGGMMVGVAQIVYVLPIALFVASRGNTARAAGMILPWPLALLLFWSMCGRGW